MEVQYDNPYEVGMTGLLGMPSGYYSMHEAEVLVMLGTDFPYSAFLPDDIKIVQVDIKPERLGRRAKVDLGFAEMYVLHSVPCCLCCNKRRMTLSYGNN